MSRIAPVLLLPIAATAAWPAAAQDGWGDWQRRSIEVRAADLDLAVPAGMDELTRRIGRVVRRICGYDRACQDEAWASTEPQVAWAVERDGRLHELAGERAAQLEACAGIEPCPAPVAYVPPPAPPVPAGSRVTVTIVYGAPSVTVYTAAR
jgi:UrcA family protein